MCWKNYASFEWISLICSKNGWWKLRWLIRWFKNDWFHSWWTSIWFWSMYWSSRWFKKNGKMVRHNLISNRNINQDRNEHHTKFERNYSWGKEVTKWIHLRIILSNRWRCCIICCIRAWKNYLKLAKKLTNFPVPIYFFKIFW